MQWLAEICVKRPIFALMLVLSIVVTGAFSFFALGVDRFPNVDFPVVSVTLRNPGASPEEIETEIIDRLEQELNTISGIDEMRSTAAEGIAQIFITFKLEKNVDVAAQEVRDKTNLVVPELPETAEEPVVQKVDVNAAPILQIAVSASVSARELYDIADQQIAEKLQNASCVGQVQIIGGAEREIQINLNTERMRAFGVTATDVAAAVRQQNRSLPGGRVDQASTEIAVRTMGKLPRVEQFGDIPVALRDNYNVRLKDVAEILDGIKERRTVSYLNGIASVTLLVRKQSGTNSLTVAETVKHRLEEIKPNLSPRLNLEIVGDQSVFIEASVHAVYEHLILGSVLACVVVFLFLWNIRLTLISAIAIPASIIGTFAIMYALGYTLNIISLLALTLMVGIVIDDAIIVLENIYHFIEAKGLHPFRAAVEGTREVGLAVLATTMSLLAVFLPIGFMGGLVGRFMSAFGVTSAAAIIISLFISFTLTPMLCARFIRAKKQKNAEQKLPALLQETARQPTASPAFSAGEAPSIIANTDSWFYKQIEAIYLRMLAWSMRHRRTILVLCVLVFLSNLVLFPLVGFDFVPEDDESQFQVSLRLPEGTALSSTALVVERIAGEIRKQEGVSDTLTTVGGGEQNLVNAATIYVKLKPIKERAQSQSHLVTATRDLLNQYPENLRKTVSPLLPVGGTGERSEKIQYLIVGPQIEMLTDYSVRLKERLQREVPDAIDIDTSLTAGKPEWRIEIDRARATDLGVSVENISEALNIMLSGVEASTFNDGSDQYDVRVRAGGDVRRDENDLNKMSVRSEKGEIISLNQLVKIVPSNASATIDRYDRQRQVTVYANIRQGGSISDVTAKIDGIVKELSFAPEYKPTVTGQAKNLAESGFYFLLAVVLTFIFMYMVLAAQFESLIHPVTILLTLPLAVPFGVLCLLLTGQSMNIFTLLGLLVLFGIVKKNAILQIDHTNQLRAKGMNRHDAIIQANRDRLRPILMTTIAFVAGMIPLLVSTGAGAATNRSIGTLVAGGQSLCLILTLLAVPVFYSLFDDLGQLPLFRGTATRWKIIKRRLRQRRLRAKSKASSGQDGLSEAV